MTYTLSHSLQTRDEELSNSDEHGSLFSGTDPNRNWHWFSKREAEPKRKNSEKATGSVLFSISVQQLAGRAIEQMRVTSRYLVKIFTAWLLHFWRMSGVSFFLFWKILNLFFYDF
jgi:hypothetical protein